MKKTWTLLLLLAIGKPFYCLAHESEYQIKAVFLEQFTRFIEWPKQSGTPDAIQPFTIAVIGQNPFDTLLEDIYIHRKIQDRAVNIQYFSSPDEIKDCHILFISKTNKQQLSEILSYTQNKPILTIGDTEGFAQQGVLINFYLTEDNVKFEINEKGFHQSGLNVSYILLNLAKIVHPLRGQ